MQKDFFVLTYAIVAKTGVKTVSKLVSKLVSKRGWARCQNCVLYQNCVMGILVSTRRWRCDLWCCAAAAAAAAAAAVRVVFKIVVDGGLSFLLMVAFALATDSARGGYPPPLSTSPSTSCSTSCDRNDGSEWPML